MQKIGSQQEYSRSEVPAAATVSGFQIALVKIGVLIALPAFIMGAEFGFTLGLPRALLAMTLGAAVLAALSILTGTVAARSRLSTSLIVRYAFGPLGARVISGVLAITLLGLYGVTAELFGASLSRISEHVFGTAVGTAPCIIGGSFLMVLTTIYGFRGLQRLADLAVPVLLLALAAVAWSSAMQTSAAELWATPRDPASLGIGISAVIGGLAVGITIFPDLARFARTPGHAQGAAIASYGVGVPVVLLLAAIPSVVTGERDLIMIMTGLGLGIPAFVFMVFTAWTTNSGNLYSSSLGLANVFTRPSFPVLAAVAGLIGTVFALLGVSARLMPLLVMLGVTIPPIAGIYLADFFLIRRQRYDEAALETMPAVSWPAFAAWILAVAIALFSARQGIRLTGVPACDAIIIASVTYSSLAWGRLRLTRRLLSRGSSS